MAKRRSRQHGSNKHRPRDPVAPPARPPRRLPYLACVLLALLLVALLAWWGQRRFRSVEAGRPERAGPPRDERMTQDPALTIESPWQGSVFPADIAPARFRWQDTTRDVDRWIVRIEFSDHDDPLEFASDVPEWTPSGAVWETIKQNSREAQATVTICGTDRQRPQRVLSQDQVSIRTSVDEVGAPIFYREVNLPFSEAIKDPAARIRWRFGAVSSPQQPPVILEKMPLCGNCHSFSSDGSVLGMDVDYGSDKGSYILCPVSDTMVYDNAKIISWSDYRPEDNRGTFGLLSQVSPDGRYVLSTVKDRSVFVAVDDLDFSQLFFPIQGILAYYDRQAGTFHALRGADDEQYVQSNPAWSPDGKYVVFARAKAYYSERLRERQRGLLKKEDVSEFLEGGQTFQFDLWRVPFNDGQGGQAEPLEGASQNGMSNYFAKYSPDGRWIVFCRAASFMLLQPDSELYILPAAGGAARRLECNTSRMNSWHSWSPNGKWLVFSSKANSPYTQLFLTHVDDQGHTTPPVVLEHFTSPDMAANIPEFVNAAPDAIQQIRQEFIDDLAYLQAGRWNAHDGDYDLAIQAFQKALEINPDNGKVHVAWGDVLVLQGKLQEAAQRFSQAIALDPANTDALCRLGALLAQQGRSAEALARYQQALQFDPASALAHQSLGSLLLSTGSTNEGRNHLYEAARLDPESAQPYIQLGASFLREQRVEQAETVYRLALQRQPHAARALMGLATTLMAGADRKVGNRQEAVRLAEQAFQLSEYQSPEALLVLSNVYVAAGRPSDALAAAQRALQTAGQTGNAELAAAARALLQQGY